MGCFCGPQLKTDVSANSLRVMKGAALSVVLLTWEDAGLSGLAVIQPCFWWCLHSIVEQSLWDGCWWFAFAGWQNGKCFRSQLWCRGHQGPSFVSTEMLLYSQKGSGRGEIDIYIVKNESFLRRVYALKEQPHCTERKQLAFQLMSAWKDWDWLQIRCEKMRMSNDLLCSLL